MEKHIYIYVYIYICVQTNKFENKTYIHIDIDNNVYTYIHNISYYIYMDVRLYNLYICIHMYTCFGLAGLLHITHALHILAEGFFPDCDGFGRFQAPLSGSSHV